MTAKSKKNQNVEKPEEGSEELPRFAEVITNEPPPDLNALEQAKAAADSAWQKGKDIVLQGQQDKAARERAAKAAEEARILAEKMARNAFSMSQPYRQMLDEAYSKDISEPVKDVLAAILASVSAAGTVGPDNQVKPTGGNPRNAGAYRMVKALAGYRDLKTK